MQTTGNMRTVYVALVTATLLGGCTDTRMQSMSENSLPVTPEITLAGSLVEGSADRLKHQGAVVIDLRGAQEGAAQEAEQLRALGVPYFNVPVGLANFSPATVRQVDQLLMQHAGKPIVIHCESANRAGLVWAALQQERGMDPMAALSVVSSVATKDVIRQAILDYGS